MIESWLFQHCWPMGYSSYDPTRMRDMKSRIMHAIQMLASWDGTVAHSSSHSHIADAAMGVSSNTNGWTTTNPAFFPPPPTQIQLDHAGWTSSSQHGSHAQGSSTRKHNPSLTLDDWQVPLPRPKSQSHPQSHSQHHRASASHSGWHPQAEGHVRQFDSHIESMLRASHSREGLALPVSTEPAVIPTARRKRDKQRDADRKRDRISKWFARDTGAAVLATDTDDSDDEWRPREKSRRAEKEPQEDQHRGIYQQQQQYQQQQFQHQHQSSHQSLHSFSHMQEQPAPRSRSSQHQSHSQTQPHDAAWQIYAQPHTTQPHSSQPLATIDPNRQARSRSADPRRQRRPPSLELEPLDELASSIHTLGIF